MYNYQIFNPNATDKQHDRQLFHGQTSGIIDLNNVKYNWGVQLYNQMREYFWIPERFDLTDDVTCYNELTAQEKRAYKGILSYLVYLDSMQVNNVPYLMQFITAPEVKICLAEQISQECFDKKTELLTEKGWVNVQDITLDSRVAQYDLDTESISFCYPSKVHKYKYAGKMRFYYSDRTNICVTPLHELICIDAETNKKHKRIAQLEPRTNSLYPTTGLFEGNLKCNNLDLLLIACSADGSITQLTNGSFVEIHLSKQEKRNRLEKLLEKMAISYTCAKVKKKKKQYLYSFYLPKTITQDELKSLNFLLKPYSEKSAKQLLKESLFWHGKKGTTFYSTNKPAIDNMQIIAMRAGFTSTIGLHKTKGKSSNACYFFSVSKQQSLTYPSATEIDYNDFVYCVTVPHHNVVSRRNGCVAITGNSMHGKSYANMIETVIPPQERDIVYHYWKENRLLFERCKLIGKYYQQTIDSPTEENITISFVADYLLESLFFYMGFMFFYNLSSRNLMNSTVDHIRLINRDELSHLRLYQKIVQERLTLTPNVLEDVYRLIEAAVQKEIDWNCDIIGDQILGLTTTSIVNYIHYLANTRLKAIGLEPLYPPAKNPFKHLEKLADSSSEANIRSNFFDGSVTSYNMSTALEGYDEF